MKSGIIEIFSPVTFIIRQANESYEGRVVSRKSNGIMVLELANNYSGHRYSIRGVEITTTHEGRRERWHEGRDDIHDGKPFARWQTDNSFDYYGTWEEEFDDNRFDTRCHLDRSHYII